MSENYRVEYIENYMQFSKHIKSFLANSRVKDVHVMGLDTEFVCRANHPHAFSEDDVNDIKVCILQLATKGICLVINLINPTMMSKTLIEILTSPNYMKYGVNLDMDMTLLSKQYKEIGHCSSAYDLEKLAKLAGVRNPNLVNIYNLCFPNREKTTSKSSGDGDWFKAKISKPQLTYAANDAIRSYELGLYFNDNTAFANIKPSIPFMIEPVLIIPDFKEEYDINHSISALNEYSQKNNIAFPTYEFKMVTVNNTSIQFNAVCMFKGCKSHGFGLSKKESKKKAALEMCKLTL